MTVLDSLRHADLIIVGSGLYGLTVADHAARDGHTVAIIEARHHPGGNAWSEPCPDTGIEIHRYGSHIFHTSDPSLWDYASRFTDWHPYRHHVRTVHAGRNYPMPISLATISQYLDRHITPEEARAWIAHEASACDDDPGSSLEAKALHTIGRPLYDAFIRGYTAKQWDTDPRDLPAATIARLPVRYTWDTRYFTDPYEGIPHDGYGTMLQRMTQHPRIRLHLGIDWHTLPRPAGIPLIYTGPIDRYFHHRLGHLGWRTLDLTTEVHPVPDYQGCAVLNYADLDEPRTRTHEFQHYITRRDRTPGTHTVVMHETSRRAHRTDEPYYPINSAHDRALLSQYRTLATTEPHTHFGGRLGTYKYLDMHAAIAAARHDYTGPITQLLHPHARTLPLPEQRSPRQ